MIPDFFRTSQKRLKEIKQQQALARLRTEREVCALVSSGNISLQRGEYITNEDMDILQNEMEAFFFSEKSKW
jgi:hypothetical protein